MLLEELGLDLHLLHGPRETASHQRCTMSGNSRRTRHRAASGEVALRYELEELDDLPLDEAFEVSAEVEEELFDFNLFDELESDFCVPLVLPLDFRADPPDLGDVGLATSSRSTSSSSTASSLTEVFSSFTASSLSELLSSLSSSLPLSSSTSKPPESSMACTMLMSFCNME
mmetsp:Transcript_45812/g.117697  ORF Transcript_45812/g.117697 Transcript_45812/m.117697 type:complete len:172 (-) Transcript_45812:346-861(-)